MTDRMVPRWYDDDEPQPAAVFRFADSLCASCAHSWADVGDPGSCDAFPLGIPPEIVRGDFDHRQPWAETADWPSDGGIQYEPRDGGSDA